MGNLGLNLAGRWEPTQEGQCLFWAEYPDPQGKVALKMGL